MKVIFKIRKNAVEAYISPASVVMMDDLSPITAADLWKDILFDAQDQYDRAVRRLHDGFAARVGNER